MTFKLGDRVRLVRGAQLSITWRKNKNRIGTVVRIHDNDPYPFPIEVDVLWDGKISLEDWWEQALEKVEDQKDER
jgi:hypothetical protein